MRCREMSQQYQIEILHSTEIGRHLLCNPSLCWTRRLPGGEFPREESQFFAGRSDTTGAAEPIRHGSISIPVSDYEDGQSILSHPRCGRHPSKQHQQSQ